MIEKEEGFGDALFNLTCDVCGYVAPELFDTFYDAVSYKKDKDNEWTSKCINGEWEDRCPECSV